MVFRAVPGPWELIWASVGVGREKEDTQQGPQQEQSAVFSTGSRQEQENRQKRWREERGPREEDEGDSQKIEAHVPFGSRRGAAKSRAAPRCHSVAYILRS